MVFDAICYGGTTTHAHAHTQVYTHHVDSLNSKHDMKSMLNNDTIQNVYIYMPAFVSAIR